jgi:hypothetical protein
MANLIAIVRATRASANALDSMSHYASEASDCSAVIARNLARVAAGHLTMSVADIGNRIAQQRKDSAVKAYNRAVRTFERAQRVLADNPLPGDSR